MLLTPNARSHPPPPLCGHPQLTRVQTFTHTSPYDAVNDNRKNKETEKEEEQKKIMANRLSWEG
jgi:hypothetical protein